MKLTYKGNEAPLPLHNEENIFIAIEWPESPSKIFWILNLQATLKIICFFMKSNKS